MKLMLGSEHILDCRSVTLSSLRNIRSRMTLKTFEGIDSRLAAHPTRMHNNINISIAQGNSKLQF